MENERGPEKINLELINYKLNELKAGVDDLRKYNEEKVVSRTEFELRVGRVEKLVYGAIGMGLLALGKALIELVVK